MKISVAMATFNGAKYIREQLNSIQNQIYLPFELVVCDDGSSDDTLPIIREFAKSAPFAVRVYENECNLGFSNNFLKCASLCSGEWIAFCDQDDIWVDDKLSVIRDVVNRSSDELVLIFHAAELVDQNLRPVGIRLPAIERERVFPISGNSGFWFVGGCVMCFKASLIDDVDSHLRPRDNYQFNDGWVTGKYPWMPHDKWICMLANISGEVAATPRILSMYRRHDHALTGAHVKNSATMRIKNHILTDSVSYDFLSKSSSETADALLKISSNIRSYVRQKSLIDGAKKYKTISCIFRLRAKLYSSNNVSTRFINFGKLISMKAYRGNGLSPLNTYSFVKDLIFAMRIGSAFEHFFKHKLK